MPTQTNTETKTTTRCTDKVRFGIEGEPHDAHGLPTKRYPAGEVLKVIATTVRAVDAEFPKYHDDAKAEECDRRSGPVLREAWKESARTADAYLDANGVYSGLLLAEALIARSVACGGFQDTNPAAPSSPQKALERLSAVLSFAKALDAVSTASTKYASVFVDDAGREPSARETSRSEEAVAPSDES